MQSAAKTVAEYLASLPEDRRKGIAQVRALVKKHLPKGYVESMMWGMITWSVPLRVKPDTYNGQPLCYVALASQKQYMALYLTGPYMKPALQKRLAAGFKAAGKKLDMGKSCLRFKRVEDLVLEPIAEAVAAVPMAEFIAASEKIHGKKK